MGMWCRNPAVAESIAGGRAVLFNPDRQLTLVLNPVGTLVWVLLGQPASTSALAVAMSAHFEGVGQDRIRADVERFVGQLVERDMVRAQV
jgi:hypothetical protein